MPVIPATQEAEAGELPEPRRRRLRWAEVTPLHSSLGNESETPSQKKKKKEIPNLWIFSVLQEEATWGQWCQSQRSFPVYDDSKNFLSNQEGRFAQMIKRQDLFPKSACSP